MWWHEVLATLREEFSDLGDAAGVTRVAVRLIVVMLLAGLLGYNREKNASAAGLRTHMLVGVGAALFVIAPQQAGMSVGDLSRVLQGVVAGIGFLGAGAIIKMRDREEIKGLTTAASIWATAAIGIAVGMGREMTAVLATVLALVILALVPKLERTIEKKRRQDAGEGLVQVESSKRPNGPDASG